MSIFVTAILAFIAGYCGGALFWKAVYWGVCGGRASPSTREPVEPAELTDMTEPYPHLNTPDDPLDLPCYRLAGNRYFSEAIRILKALREQEDARLPEVLGQLRRMSPYAFEELIAFCLCERGYRGRTSGQYSRDGGIDGWACIGGVSVVIQAKRWRRHICNRDISQLAKVASAHSAHGLFVHTGRTGRLARRVARVRGVSIISGNALVDLVLGRSLDSPIPKDIFPAGAVSDGIVTPSAVGSALIQ